MISFKEFSDLLDEEIDEGAIKTKAWHYTKAISRNVMTPSYALIRRVATQRHVDRYKMHKRIASDTSNSAKVRENSKKKMEHHMAAIKKRMEAD